MARRPKSRSTGGRRRRTRNPRTGARDDSEAEGATEWAAPLEVILDVSRGALVDFRAMIEGVGTEAEADAELKSFLLRLITQLEILCERATEGDGEERLFSLAWVGLATTLDLEWLDAERNGLDPGLSREELDHVGRLEQEALEWESGGGRWDGLFELIFDAVKMFGDFSHWEGVRGCLELHQELERQVAAERQGG